MSTTLSTILSETDRWLERLSRGDAAGTVRLLRQHLELSAEEATEAIKVGLARIYAESVA